MPTPAKQLVGKSLGNGWSVKRSLNSYQSTGGFFSEPYLVQNSSGAEAFLKAIDLSSAASGNGSLADNLKSLLDAFIHERDLLLHCSEQRIKRVVVAFESGEIRVNQSPLGRVPYIIFERAVGDVRVQMTQSQSFDTAWSLRALHNVSTALKQLHANDIAHQDLKPSNVLYFKDKGAKLGDLGRASKLGSPAAHDSMNCPGALMYGPPELLYGYTLADWRDRRFGADMYLLGSMIVFLFSGTPLTAWIKSKVGDEQSWVKWGDSYSHVIPHLRAGFADVVNDLQSIFPSEYCEQLTTIVREMCDPDPALRGHPKDRAQTGNSYNMERYISQFNSMAKRAEFRLKTKVQC